MIVINSVILKAIPSFADKRRSVTTALPLSRRSWLASEDTAKAQITAATSENILSTAPPTSWGLFWLSTKPSHSSKTFQSRRIWHG